MPATPPDPAPIPDATDDTMRAVIDHVARLAVTVISAAPRDPDPAVQDAAGDVVRQGRAAVLGGKYMVWRTDLRDRPGDKHHGCRYFVLDTTHDPASAAAIAAYAAAVARSNPTLATALVHTYLED